MKDKTSIRNVTQAEAQDMVAYSNAITSARQAAEWGMRALQGSFGRLRMPLDITNHQARGDLIETCVRLHNLRTRKIGRNQIKSVYLPVWTSGENQFFERVHAMMFPAIRRNDRISRYYVELEQ
jgi:hypothetical protein